MSNSQRLRANLDANTEDWIEIDEDYYHHLLNVVPPVRFRVNGHIMGEPYRHDDDGTAFYICTLAVRDCTGNRRFIAKICTIAEWEKLYPIATYESLTSEPTYHA